MDEKRQFLLFLSMFDLSYQKCKQIVDKMDNQLSLKKFIKTDFKDILQDDVHKNMLDKANPKIIENFVSDLENHDIIVVTHGDSYYPKKLLELPDYPYYLFCMGDLNLFNSTAIAIVGTRKPSNYGRVVTGKFARELAKNGVTIISGLAYGIDSISHKECLDVNGKTIAVLGSGFNNIYPATHYALARQIAKDGLLLSEYLPNKNATKYSFPQRNRIIAGLSDGVLITEAGIKSGTVHTRDFALDYGKNLYAVPGNIDNYTSELPNEIIKCGQAQCVTEPNDILLDLNMEKKQQKTLQLSIDEQAIINLLNDGMKEEEYLVKNCKLPMNVFNICLTKLEIRGIINRLPGGYIALS